jgi:hypothetical protein
LEAAWLDQLITEEEKIFLEKKRAKLGLSYQEASALETEVIGLTLDDIRSRSSSAKAARKHASGHYRSTSRNFPVRVFLEKSPICLQSVADVPDVQNSDPVAFVRQTHFPVSYVVVVENHSAKTISDMRIHMKSADGQQRSIRIPTIKDRERLELYPSDLEGWCVMRGDTFVFTGDGMNEFQFRIGKKRCNRTDQGVGAKLRFPCVVFLRRSSFSSDFVFRVYNTQSQDITITGFHSSAGSISSQIEIPKGEIAEIGWGELSESRNMRDGDEFQMSVKGFRDVYGVVLKGASKIEGNPSTAIEAIEGLPLAALVGR